MNLSAHSRNGAGRSVLLIGNFLSGQGVGRGVCEDLSERLSESGWDVCWASGRKARVARLLDMLATIWSQRRRYQAAQVEVYSGPAFVWAEACCWLLQRLERPYVLTLHGGALPQFAARNPARVQRLLGPAGAVTAPSDYLARSMRRYRDDIQLVPNALDIDRYRFRRRAPAAPRLIWLRALHSIYNPRMAVEVLRMLLPRFPEASLSMVGPDRGDGTLQAVRAEVERLGLTGKVQFSGECPKTEVPAHLDRGDIFLNTTNVDNTPVSVLEAMACGLCVVSTNVGGIPDLVEDGREALLVPPKDPAAMAAAVERILTDDELAARLSTAGRRRTEAMAWREVLPRWDRLFSELAGRPELAEVSR